MGRKYKLIIDETKLKILDGFFEFQKLKIVGLNISIINNKRNKLSLPQ